MRTMATITIYKTDGTKTVEERPADQYPDLKELQSFVGGLIQAVDYYIEESGAVAYANEEGLLLGMEINPSGQEAVKWPEPLVGPVVVLEGFEREEC